LLAADFTCELAALDPAQCRFHFLGDRKGDLMIVRALIGLVLASVFAWLGVAWFAAQGRIDMPQNWNDRWNPFSPFDVQAPRGPLSRWRRWRATHDPNQCMLALATARITYQPIADSRTADGCALEHAVRVERLDSVAVSSSFLATCPLALSLAVYVRDYLQPAAQAVYGQEVQRIDHVGSYACRNVNRAPSGSLSEHAFADAIDIEGFVLEDGTRVTIGRDWPTDTRASRFLHASRDGACEVFHAVLGPDYNALHRAHFHLDMGSYRICS
jgi:hypothetical protein